MIAYYLALDEYTRGALTGAGLVLSIEMVAIWTAFEINRLIQISRGSR